MYNTVPNRFILFLIALLSVAGVGFSLPDAGATPETIRQYLSGRDAENPVQWEFHCSAGRNSGVWTNIAVPACWELQGFGEFRYGFQDRDHEPIRGDYRHTFNVPSDWKGRSVFVVFDGVMTDASVKSGFSRHDIEP